MFSLFIIESRKGSFVLNYKKELFLQEVKKAAINFGVILPKVKFWKHYEHHFDRVEGGNRTLALRTTTACSTIKLQPP